MAGTGTARLAWLLSAGLLLAGCGKATPASTPLEGGVPDGDAPSDGAPADRAPATPDASGTDTTLAPSDAPAAVDTAVPPVDAKPDTTSPSDATPNTDAAALPSPQPPGFPAGSASRTESRSFAGSVSKQTIGFNIYLPPAYAESGLRYPVVYDLHGLGGSQYDNGQWVIPSLEAAMKAKAIGPVIVVFPEGLPEAYYTDSKDGTKPSETRIIRDLIPYIDANYRTVAHRQLRAVTGFSMGGYGSMELATKFPDVFRVGIAYDAALDTWQTLVGRRAYIATAQFGDDEAYFNQYSPWANATKNAAALRAGSSLRLVPGTQYQAFDASFRDHLAKLPVPLDYVETTCPHDYGCLLTSQGAKSWAFIQAAFEKR
jgi:S-formylglutathione hydrolase FrmB